MNVVGKISLGVAAIVALQFAGRAESAALPRHDGKHAAVVVKAVDLATDNSTPDSTDTPYATIVARNIFGLVPIPPPPPPPPPQEDPPPKITANGIMNVFGELEALFKVSFPAKGSTPAKDQSYMLSQGQRQDDIEVVKIDEPNASITFDNHGTTQEIPLVPAAKGTGSVSSPAVGGPHGGFNPGTPSSFSRLVPGGGFDGGGSGTARPQGQNNPALNGGGASGAGTQLDVAAQAAQNTANLTPEQQAVLIEAERARLLSTEKPEFPPEMLPPTKLSPPDESAPGQSGNIPGAPGVP